MEVAVGWKEQKKSSLKIWIIRISHTWDRYVHAGHSPFGAAEQRSRWQQDAEPDPSVSEFLASHHCEQHKGARRAVSFGVSFSSLFFWTSKRIMPRGERRQTEATTKRYRKYMHSFTGRTQNIHKTVRREKNGS